MIFKVNRPLMPHQYEELEKRVRLENEKSGLKIVVTMIVGTFLENPSLVAGNGNIGSLSITLNALIAQLRLSCN